MISQGQILGHRTICVVLGMSKLAHEAMQEAAQA